MKSKIKHFYITMMIAIVAFGGVMTGCGSSEKKTLLKTENVIVTRSGHDTEVLDVKGDKKHTYTLKRVRKGTEGSHRASSTESKYIKIIVAGKVIVIEDKGSGDTYYF